MFYFHFLYHENQKLISNKDYYLAVLHEYTWVFDGLITKNVESLRGEIVFFWVGKFFKCFKLELDIDGVCRALLLIAKRAKRCLGKAIGRFTK